jgi:hypothetical protein
MDIIDTSSSSPSGDEDTLLTIANSETPSLNYHSLYADLFPSAKKGAEFHALFKSIPEEEALIDSAH